MGIRVTNLGYISTLKIEDALVSGSRRFKQIVYSLVLSPIILTVGEASSQPTPTDVRSDTVRFYPEVYLGVKGGIRKTPLGLTTFVRDTTDATVVQVADVIFNVLRDDLRYSGRFDVLADSAIVDSTGHGSLLDIWSAAGARGLVRGEVRRTLDHTELFATLYRLPDGRLLIAKSYVVDLDRARSVAHRLNDDIIYSLLGQRGVALSQIAFVSKRNGDKEIFVMGYDGHGARQVTDDGTVNLSPEWSPDGKQIAYSSLQHDRWELFIADVLTGFTTPIRTSSVLNISPAWSPDGRQILFSVKDGDNIDLYTITTSGWRLRRLTDHPETDTEPAWSPGGDRIAFTSDRSGIPQIYMMDRDGSNLGRLTWEPDAYEGSPRWSPDGKKLAFVRRGFEGFDVYVTEVEGGTPFRLTAGGSNEDPSWSPDGLQIVFWSDRNGREEIYVMNWDGTNVRRLTPGISPAWSPALMMEQE